MKTLSSCWRAQTVPAASRARAITAWPSAFIIACLFSLPVAAAMQSGREGIKLEGIVRDQTGKAVAGAQVSLKDGPIVAARTQTEADGRFVFEDVNLREGRLLVQAEGFAEVERKWSVATAGATLLITLEPSPVAAEVTVTATRTESRLDETAASVVVLTPAELSATAAVRLDDALRQVAGFNLFRRSSSRTANPTTQGVSLRGTGASGASRALVLLDGIPLNDPFGGWVNWGRIPRSSVGRIEVLRGGASHLYGSGALGGVVNVLTDTPTAPFLFLETSYGSQRTPDATLSAGIKRGGWATSLSAEIFSTGGAIIVREAERGRVDIPASSRNSSIDLSIHRRLASRGRLFLRGALFGESRQNGTPLQTNRTHLRQLSAGGDWQSKLLGSFTVRAYGGTQLFDQNFSAISTDRNTETLTRIQRVPSQFAGLTLQWSRTVGPRQTLIAGLEAREVRGASDELIYTQNRPSSLASGGGRERAVGLFVEDVFHLSPRFMLNAGLRLDAWRESAGFSAARSLRAISGTTLQQFPERTERALSPNLSVLYRPFEKIALSASFTRSFRQPTLNELYRTFRVGDVLTLANENLRAESATNGEAAASLGLFNHKLNTRATLFWTEVARPVANVTLSVTPGLIIRRRENLGRTRSRGLELESELKLNERWAITGGYLLSDATVIEFPANITLEGLRLPQVARHQYTFQMRYTNPSRFTFGLQGRGAGNQFDDDQNLLPLGRYFSLDGLISKPLRRGLEIFAAAENLLNQRFTVGRTPVTTTATPLLIRFGFRLRLGAH